MVPRIAVLAALIGLLSFPAAASPALDVTITIGPEGTVSADSASFTFAANERATFSCSLDGAPAVTCASPVSYSGLADGPHLFSVQARNRDSRGTEFVAFDRRAWTVDRSVAPPPGIPPLVPGLAGPGGAPEPGRIVEELGDTDADGVAPARDRCPTTPPGQRLLAGGCAAVEIVASPRPFAEAADAALTKARAWQRSGAARLRPGQRLMANADSALSRALGLVEEGAVCPGAREAGAALTGLARGERRLAPLYRRLARRLARLPRHGDAGPAETGIMGLSVAARLTDTAQRETARLRGLLRRLCAAQSGTRRLTGTIAAVDDARGLLTMNDGNVLALAGAVRGRPSEGAGASLSAVTFAGGGGIVRGVGLDPGKTKDGVALEGPVPEATVNPCIALRVAPVQPFAPPLPVAGPYTLHDPRAYGTSAMALEAGMRLAAARTCPETGDPNTAASTYKVRSLRLRISYTKLSNHKPVKNKLLAAELTRTDEPVPLLGDIHPTAATLEVQPQAKSCSNLSLAGQPPPCGLPKAVGPAKKMSVTVRPNGDYARAVYERKSLVVDTLPAGSYATDSVVKVETEAPLSGTPVTFSAEGYRVDGGASSRPVIAAVGKLEPFAVYMDDFYTDVLLWPAEQTGADKPSALRWPRVKGKRSGREFWYLTELPEIQRDLVSVCSGVDSYYRLPFADVSTWRLGNGNYDDPNGGGHAKGSGKGNDQRYAFDFGYDNSDQDSSGDEGAEVRAARPGRVIDLQENESGNSWKKGTLQGDGTKEDGPVPTGYTGVGNFVVIEHGDDTVSAYWHNKKNTTVVNVGDRVQRGQLLAKSGNTGNSSEPHLHWDVRTDWELAYPAQFIEFPSKLVKVQDKNHNCWRPREADTYASNNEETP